MEKIQVQDQHWKLQTKPYHPRPEKSVKLTFQCPKKVDEQNRTCYVAQAVYHNGQGYSKFWSLLLLVSVLIGVGIYYFSMSNGQILSII